MLSREADRGLFMCTGAATIAINREIFLKIHISSQMVTLIKQHQPAMQRWYETSFRNLPLKMQYSLLIVEA